GGAVRNRARARPDLLSAGKGLHAWPDPELAQWLLRAGAVVLGDRQEGAKRRADRPDGAGEAALWAVRAVGAPSPRMALRRCGRGDHDRGRAGLDHGLRL